MGTIIKYPLRILVIIAVNTALDTYTLLHRHHLRLLGTGSQAGKRYRQRAFKVSVSLIELQLPPYLQQVEQLVVNL